MTGILVPLPGRRPASSPTPLTSLQGALSSETNKLAEKIAALRNPQSPASLLPASCKPLEDKPLEEQLFDALTEAKILTSQVAMHLDDSWRLRLFSQLDQLHDPEEWEEGDRPLQRASFETFLKAMLSIKPERRPGLGLSHAGYLVAAWTTGADRLTIEFLSNNQVRWVLSRRYEEEDEDHVERFAAEIPITSLVKSLEFHHPGHWFDHEKKNHQLTG